MQSDVSRPGAGDPPQEACPWTTQRGRVKFVEFAARAPHLTRREFHLYWQRHHSPHVMNCTAFSQYMQKYVTTHSVPRPESVLPDHYEPVPAFEGVAEVWLASLDEALAWLSHPIYAELIQPDELRFIDQTGLVEIVIVREEQVLRAAPDLSENGLVKVHAVLRKQAGLTADEFHRRLSEAAHEVAATPALAALLRQFVISHRLADPQPEGFPIAAIDGVAEFWFDGLDAASSFFSSTAYARTFAAAEKSLIAGGRARAVVAIAHVVHDEYSFQPTVMQPQSFPWSG